MFLSKFEFLAIFGSQNAGVWVCQVNYLKNRSELGFLEVFGHILKKFLMPDHETWVTGILWVLPGVKNGPELSQKPVSRLFCKRFPLDWNQTCFLSSLEPIWGVCKTLVPKGAIFGVFFNPEYGQKVSTGFTWKLSFKPTGTTFGSV